MTVDRSSDNPFVRYRRLLDSYRLARERGWSDDDFVDLVHSLDDDVAAIEGCGFRRTPLTSSDSLAAATDATTVWLKDDTPNVGGSHKARHLFGVMLHLALDADRTSPLAIASCGNAALAAAILARSQDRPLQVFIPTWADEAVVRRLDDLGAIIEVADRRSGESGDPAYLRFLEAVGAGATPFSVQGTVTPETIDGGRTLGWEIAERLGEAGASGRLRIFLQIGGGAMASSVIAALDEAIELGWLDVDPVIFPVQTEACAPLVRAWRLVCEAVDRGADPGEVVRARPDDFMWSWDPVGTSVATGILDDVAYDWAAVVTATVASGGQAIEVPESRVVGAHELGRTATTIDVGPTGTAGLAGLLESDGTDPALVLFTGRT